MTGKNYQWHRAWRRDAEGRLQHDSGVRVLAARADGFTDFQIDPASLREFQAAQQARGIPMPDTLARLKRLLKEAQQWHARNP